MSWPWRRRAGQPRVPGRAGLVACAAAFLLLAPSPARPLYDPAFRWRTLVTPHFQVHFHQGEEALAGRVAELAEAAHERLVPLLGNAPAGPTHLVLSDDQDEANGSATPLPRNLIRLYAVPAASASELHDARDWLAQLVEHEYAHVLHLDQAGGLPAAVNAVFGKLWVPNGLTPGWLIEGVAVAHEARDGATGRNRSALFEMYARALVVEPPGLPSLAQVSNPLLEWPRGHAPYLLGGRFVEFLLARSGPEALRGFLAEQGRQVWPWAPSWAGQAWFGAGFPALWEEFGAALAARAAADLAAIRTRPVTRPARLTWRGGQVERPRFTPDGAALVYVDRGPHERAGLRRVALDGRDLGLAVPVDLHGRFDLTPDGRALLSRAEVWREFRVYDDLWLADLATGRAERLTEGERATDPALAPGGAAVVYVARSGGGEHELRRRSLPGGPAELLLHRPGAQLYDPAVSPDGQAVALSLQEGGRRDLVVLRQGRVERVTDDDALDLEPAWTPDGAHLLFASDRGGVFNLYAWEAATGQLRQVTNVETGALDPAVSPDGKTIAFVTYGREGYDLATMPFEPATWLEATPAATPTATREPPHPGPLPQQAGGEGEQIAPVATSTSPSSSPAAHPERSAAGAESRGTATTSPSSSPYRPWTALPTFWLPLWGADDAGDLFGAYTAGQDVVGQHTWQAQAWWSAGARTAGYAATYVGAWSWPALDLVSQRLLVRSPGEPDRLTAAWTPLAAGATFTFSRLDQALQLRLGWSATRWDTVGDPGDAAAAPPGQAFADGLLSEASLGASWSNARRYARSISREEGRTLSLRLRAAGAATGSDYDLWRARAAWSEYLRVPGTRHVVLAGRLSGALAHGSLGGGPPFSLGGLSQPDPVELFLLQSFSASDQLRGYPAGLQQGNGTALLNLELRFPLASPELGRSTWPIFLRRLHGAVFADLGEAFVKGTERGYAGSGFRWDRLRLGVGAELRLETALAYWLLTDLRLGVARGLGKPLAGQGPGDDPLAEWQVYLTFGPSF